MPRASVADMPRNGGRPSKDRVMVSFYLERSLKAAVEALAAQNGKTLADTYREVIARGLGTVALAAEQTYPRQSTHWSDPPAPDVPTFNTPPPGRVFGGGS